MRKLIIATTLTLALAITATAAPPRGGAADRGPREKDTPIERVIKVIKRLITPTGLPTVPIP